MSFKDKKKSKEYNKKHYLRYKKYYIQNHKKWLEDNPDYMKEYHKYHYQKHKQQYIENAKKWRENNPDSPIKYYQKNKDKILKRNSHYLKSDKGKLADRKSKAKRKRKRELGFNLIIKNNLDESFVYHHINNNDVVCFPKDIHILYTRKNRKEHRELCLTVVKQLYPNIGILKKIADNDII